MRHPVGSKVSDGQAELTDVGALITNNFAIHAFEHTILVGLTTGSLVVFGVACWHLLRGRNIALFKKAAMLALIVAVPVTAVNMAVGSRFGIVTTTDQPMKIAAAEALWDSEEPASFSLFQIGGFTKDDPDPSVDLEVPYLLSLLSSGSFNSKVDGLNQLQSQYTRRYGRDNYIPSVRTAYWGMRVMAYLGGLMLLVAALGAYLYRRANWSRPAGFSGRRWWPWRFRSSRPLPAGC